MKSYRKTARYLLLAGSFVFLASVARADQAPSVSSSTETVPVQVKGDTVEYFHEQEKVVGTGNVRIDYDGIKLSADKITVYTATSLAVAEGNVVLVQKGSTFKGARGEYDFKKNSGNVEGMNAEIGPNLFAKAKRVDRVDEGHYRATDSYVTTCCGDNPFYRIQAKTVDVYPGEKVVVHNALLYIKNVPILFIPVYVQKFVDFDRFPVQLVPGKSSEWGAFLLSKWRYQLADSPQFTSRGNVLLDYRVKRGFAGGVENFYRGEKIGRGAARVYYAHDEDAPVEISDDRFRVQYRHQVKLTDSTTLTGEFNRLSDPTVVKDFFFREEYERDAIPDTYVSIITAKPEYTLSFLDRERVNDFQTVVERSPEVRFDTHNRRFADTNFYLRQEFQFSNLKKEFGTSDRQEDVTRLDTNQTLLYAGHVGAMSVTPRVGTRQTYYSRRLQDDEDLVRGTFDPGIDVSTRFFKTYDAYVHAMGLDYNQIRHIFTPTASYNYRPNPTVTRSLLSQFDQIDSIDKQNYVRINFENKLQTKEHTESNAFVTREIARVIPFFDYDFDTGRIDNVGLDVELRPYSWLGIDSDVEYETRTGKVTAANADLFFERGPYRFGIGHRYVQDSSAQVTTEFRWKISDEWAIKVYERYEFQEKDSKEFEFTVSKVFNCVITDFSYNHRDGDTFFVVFRLKGYEAASFSLSQSYNRPKSPAPATSRIL